jgi:hypothetical protein
MCCWTHTNRDERAQAAGEKPDLVAADDPFRCICDFGAICQRRATQEDQRCDWCRGTNHQEACDDLSPYATVQMWTDEIARFAGENPPYIVQARGPMTVEVPLPGVRPEWFR